MVTAEEVKDAVEADAAEVAAKVNVLLAEVQALKAQAATGKPVKPADLDEVLESIQSLFTG